jgi:medium-chain acyl-[acyl-carrier-protein] hydrolase
LFISARRAPQLADADPPIHQLPASAFIEQLCLRYDSIPQAVLAEAELMELLLPTLRGDFTLYETYTYSADAPLACPISVFGGLQDPRVSREHLAAWREQTQSRFTLRQFPGGHFFIQSARAELLRALSEDLTALLRDLP